MAISGGCLVTAVSAAGVPLEGILAGGTGSGQLQHVPRGLHVQLYRIDVVYESESNVDPN